MDYSHLEKTKQNRQRTLSMKIVGIAGGSASGKSTLANKLHELFHGSTIIHHDNYFANRLGMSPEELETLNFDCPEALETDLLISHLRQLKEGRSIECPVFDFTTHLRAKETLTIEPCKLLIVEGFLLFHEKEMRDLLNLKIFIDVDKETRLQRRIARDVKERGNSIENVIFQFNTHVQPMHEKYIDPTKNYADIVVNDCQNPESLDKIKARIEMLLGY